MLKFKKIMIQALLKSLQRLFWSMAGGPLERNLLQLVMIFEIK
jgi:hypothetical protein